MVGVPRIVVRMTSRRTPIPAGNCKPPGDRPATISGVVARYISVCRPRSRCELKYFRRMADIDELIERVWTKPNGKRHGHQSRIAADALRKARARLRKCKYNGIRTFDELHSLVEETIGGIPGIGELTVYDTALRIGAFLRPSRLPRRVYLHAGTRAGARALGIDGDRTVIKVGELPKVFRRLRAHEIEDCLCIYADDLKRITAR